MKKTRMLLMAVLAALLLLATALPALAIWGTLYVNVPKVNVYELDDTSSKVIKTYSGGKKLDVDALSPDGKWAQISLKGSLGFVQTEYLSETMPQSFCTHDWGKWTVEQEPTCTMTGYRYRFCKICGIRDEQDMKKVEHTYGDWRVTKEATCVTKGRRVHKCKVCGYEQEEEYLAEHKYGSWTVTKEPTCTSTGERVHICSVCSHSESEKIDMLPHDFGYQVVTEPTDHSAGARAIRCKVCGFVRGAESFDPEGTLRPGASGDQVRALQQKLANSGYLKAENVDGVYGDRTEMAVKSFQQDHGFAADGVAWPQTLAYVEHEFGPWTTVKAMSRTEAGERVRVCSDCGFEETMTVEASPSFELGTTNEGIRTFKQMLGRLGYLVSSADAAYGEDLDAAFSSFATANGLDAQSGKIRPADVDAVVNAWLTGIPAEQWKGQGGAGAPVDLSIMVQPDDKADMGEGVRAYNWAMLNKGAQRCTFVALLLNYGDAPDFKEGDVVLALDHGALNAGSGNILSGSFAVAEDWGEGSLNVAALVEVEGSGEYYLSNVAVAE